MPSCEKSKKWKVVAFPLYSDKKVLRLLRRIKPVYDSAGREVSASRWWNKGHFAHAARPKVVVIILKPGRPANLEKLVNRAAAVLERNSGKALDWAWGVKNGKAHLMVKTLAKDRETGRNALYRLDGESLEELVGMVPGKTRVRERGWER
jgi:hypothetical protein